MQFGSPITSVSVSGSVTTTPNAAQLFSTTVNAVTVGTPTPYNLTNIGSISPLTSVCRKLAITAYCGSGVLNATQKLCISIIGQTTGYVYYFGSVAAVGGVATALVDYAAIAAEVEAGLNINLGVTAGAASPSINVKLIGVTDTPNVSIAPPFGAYPLPVTAADSLYADNWFEVNPSTPQTPIPAAPTGFAYYLFSLLVSCGSAAAHSGNMKIGGTVAAAWSFSGVGNLPITWPGGFALSGALQLINNQSDTAFDIHGAYCLRPFPLAPNVSGGGYHSA